MIRLISTMMIAGAAVSCIQEINVDDEIITDQLTFSAQLAEDWNVVQTTRSAGNARFYSHQLDSSGLWIHAKVENAPDTVMTESKALDTRASAKTSISVGESMGVYAYVSKDGVKSEFMVNQKVESTDDGWVYSPVKYWPGDGSVVDLYAYLPYDEGTTFVEVADENDNPKLSYSVPSDVGEHMDLLAAQVTDAARTGSVNFNFQHILTAIKFKCADNIQEGKITRVALKGVYDSGIYDLIDAKWETSEQVENYEQSVDIQANGSVSITGDDEIFMMIPQTLPDDATIEIDFTYASPDDNSNAFQVKKTLSASIKDITESWTPGSVITYQISNSPLEWTYFLDISEEVLPSLGGEAIIDISVYRENENGEKEIINDYETDISVDGTSWSDELDTDWIDGSLENGFILEPQPFVSSDPNVLVLKQAESVTDYDLSQGQETANCYVVNASGTYKIPLVYGNALTATGSQNVQAYAPTGKPAFKDYMDREITTPYIDVPEGGDATLVWQDAFGVIKNVKLDDTRKYLEFEVDKEYIRPCNAIVAVRDEHDVIMWSWHVWVSPYKLGEGDGTYTRDNNNNSYTFMPVNLGWCDPLTGSSYGSEDRSVQIKISHDEDGFEKVITITQPKIVCNVAKGTSPYYQWGRKDPTPGADGNYVLLSSSSGDYYKDKDVYGPDEYGFQISSDAGAKSLGYSIQNPHVLIRHEALHESWCTEDTSRDNYWNATDKSGENIKSVYDPCPVGYKVPCKDAFLSVTNGKSEIYDLAYVNVISKENGRYEDYFIFNGSMSQDDVKQYQKWYLTGFRNKDGRVVEASEEWNGSHQGYYQMSEPTTQNETNPSRILYKNLFFYLAKTYSTKVSAGGVHEARAWAKSIRPVRDVNSDSFSTIGNGGEY